MNKTTEENGTNIALSKTTEEKIIAEIDKPNTLSYDFPSPLCHTLYPLSKTTLLKRVHYMDDEITIHVLFTPYRLCIDDEYRDNSKAWAKWLRPWATDSDYPLVEYFAQILYMRKGMDNGTIQWGRCADAQNSFSLETQNQDLKTYDERVFQMPMSLFELRQLLEVDESDIKRICNRSRDFNPSELFLDIRSFLWNKVYCKDWVHTICALWAMASAVAWTFYSFPYLFIWSEFGAGKTRLLVATQSCIPNAKNSVCPTISPIFRTIDKLGCAYFLDELERISNIASPQYQDLLALVNSGYTQGSTVERMDINKRIIERFETFGPKAFGSTSPPPKPVRARSIMIPIMRSSRPYPFARMDETKEIRLEQVIFALKYAWDIKEMAPEEEVDKLLEELFPEEERKKLSPRFREILGPLVVIAQVAGVLNEQEYRNHFRDCILYQIESTESAEALSREHMILAGVYKALEGMKHSINRDSGKLRPSMIQDAVKLLMQDIYEVENEVNIKLPSPNKIGLVLSKFHISKRAINGRIEYLPDMNWKERMEEITRILVAYNIPIDGLEKTLQELKDDTSLDSFEVTNTEQLEEAVLVCDTCGRIIHSRAETKQSGNIKLFYCLKCEAHNTATLRKRKDLPGTKEVRPEKEVESDDNG